MPMFYTPKPRQFHYAPRLYDPEKEEWETLKTKYRLEKGLPLSDDTPTDIDVQALQTQEVTDSDLDYFKRKVEQLDRQERNEKQKLTINDLFRKRETPQFHYVSRFDENGQLKDVDTPSHSEPVTQRRIKHRFDTDEMDRLKPVPAGKIIIYTLAAFILLIFIFF